MNTGYATEPDYWAIRAGHMMWYDRQFWLIRNCSNFDFIICWTKLCILNLFQYFSTGGLTARIRSHGRCPKTGSLSGARDCHVWGSITLFVGLNNSTPVTALDHQGGLPTGPHKLSSACLSHQFVGPALQWSTGLRCSGCRIDFIHNRLSKKVHKAS